MLDRFRRALHPRGRLYLTVELAPRDRVRALNEEARRSGLPVVEGEVIWPEPEGDLYHYYPTREQVRAWVAAAGFVVEHELEGPWEEDCAYHHLLARLDTPPG